ncbi:MAG: stage III sporulation protein AD, partial [Anaerotignaceae bacterium]
ITATILSVVLKKHSPQFSMLIGMVTGIIIFLFLADYLKRVLDMLAQLTENTGINSTYMDIVFKIIGISYVARFGSELCKDAGESAIASKIDISGKILIAVSSMPVILALLEMVQNFQ